jgi:hypothetical protein
MRRRTPDRNLTTHERSAIGAAATGAAKTLPLDLGLRHTFDRIVAVKRGVASADETLIIEQSHNGDAETPTWVTAPNLAMTGLCASPASAAAMVVAATPTARWVRVVHTNGSDNAQTALVLELTGFSS